MLNQRRSLPAWFYYFHGVADKIEGALSMIGKPDTVTLK